MAYVRRRSLAASLQDFNGAIRIRNVVTVGHVLSAVPNGGLCPVKRHGVGTHFRLRRAGQSDVHFVASHHAAVCSRGFRQVQNADRVSVIDITKAGIRRHHHRATVNRKSSGSCAVLRVVFACDHQIKYVRACHQFRRQRRVYRKRLPGTAVDAIPQRVRGIVRNVYIVGKSVLRAVIGYRYIFCGDAGRAGILGNFDAPRFGNHIVVIGVRSGAPAQNRNTNIVLTRQSAGIVCKLYQHNCIRCNKSAVFRCGIHRPIRHRERCARVCTA